MIAAETVEHLHAAMKHDFQVLVTFVAICTILLAVLVITRKP